MTLEQLRKIVEDNLSNSLLDETLELLFSVVKEGTAARDELVLLSSRWSALKNKVSLGLSTSEETDKDRNFIITGIQAFMRGLAETDLGQAPMLREGDSLHERHAYTCNRINQQDAFEYDFHNVAPAKLRFYYIYGDKVQSPEGLFRRLVYGRKGLLDVLERIELDKPNRIFYDPKPVKPRPSNMQEVARRNVLSALYTHFGMHPDTRQPLDTQQLNSLLDSPRLAGYGPGDSVYVLFTIDASSWHKERTPELVRWFITEFCKTDNLPDTSPAFFFFFGLTYKKDRADVRQEVLEVVQTSDLVREEISSALPELEQVSRDDLEAWFDFCDPLAEAENCDADEWIDRVFGREDSFDMKDVEKKLLERIDWYNDWLLRS